MRKACLLSCQLKKIKRIKHNKFLANLYQVMTVEVQASLKGRLTKEVEFFSMTATS